LPIRYASRGAQPPGLEHDPASGEPQALSADAVLDGELGEDGWASFPAAPPRGLQGARAVLLRGTIRLMAEAHQVVAAYWAAAEARDWQAFRQSGRRRRRVRGAAASGAGSGARSLRAIQHRGLPGRVAHRGQANRRRRAVRGELDRADGCRGHSPASASSEFDDSGLIARLADFWPDPYELPTSRAHLVERY